MDAVDDKLRLAKKNKEQKKEIEEQKKENEEQKKEN